MNQDAIPEILYPTPNKPDRYVVISSQFIPSSFDVALSSAESYCRTSPQYSWGIYKLDSTVEIISGVISVRSES